MTLAKVPGITGKVILIAETGSNDLARSEYAVYRFPEPGYSTDSIFTHETIRFIYPDGKHDAEAIISDSTGDIYVFTKRDNRSRIYRLGYPQLTNGINTAEFLTELPYNGVVSAAFSSDGKELIIKTYTQLKYYKRLFGQSIVECLRQTAAELKYQLEPMGEAVTFSRDGSGFFTLSEKSGANPVKMFFYKRK
jgi:hypothetical protein